MNKDKKPKKSLLNPITELPSPPELQREEEHRKFHPPLTSGIELFRRSKKEASKPEPIGETTKIETKGS